jgi:hypothetical protein
MAMQSSSEIISTLPAASDDALSAAPVLQICHGLAWSSLTFVSLTAPVWVAQIVGEL